MPAMPTFRLPWSAAYTRIGREAYFGSILRHSNREDDAFPFVRLPGKRVGH
jgi:hypothetical protein